MGYGSTKNKIVYKKGITANVYLGVVKHTGNDFDFDKYYKDDEPCFIDGIIMEEEEFVYLLEPIFAKHFDPNLNKVRSPKFEFYDDNFYKTSKMWKIFKDIENIVYLLKNKPYSDDAKSFFTDRLIIHYMPCNNIFGLMGCAITKEERLKLVVDRRVMFIDFYTKFLTWSKKMIKENPDRKYFIMRGP